LFGTYIYLDKMLYILIHIDSIDLCSVIFGWSVFFGFRALLFEYFWISEQFSALILEPLLLDLGEYVDI
jgi:hypothetical protein